MLHKEKGLSHSMTCPSTTATAGERHFDNPAPSGSREELLEGVPRAQAGATAPEIPSGDPASPGVPQIITG